LRKLYREVEIMKLLRHPHIIRLYQVKFHFVIYAKWLIFKPKWLFMQVKIALTVETESTKLLSLVVEDWVRKRLLPLL